MARGKLRIYLGAAPGVGKTYAMLSEAHRRTRDPARATGAFWSSAGWCHMAPGGTKRCHPAPFGARNGVRRGVAPRWFDCPFPCLCR
ncbi:hypothetical protein OIE43_01830 [Streptomyces pseudovenezuelae]|nr:hypothetical protein [Streptomyces pseudovenezuelae]